MKMRLILSILLVVGGLNGSQGFDFSPKDSFVMVYAHGFGEPGGPESFYHYGGSPFANQYNLREYVSPKKMFNLSPIAPDAPGRMDKAVFYTKPAVHKLANELYDAAIDHKAEQIYHVGFSCGAGTTLNCLGKLVELVEDEKNIDYFCDSKIRSKEDAEAIIKAINKGALVIKAPLLDMRNVNAIAIPSRLIGGGLIFAVIAVAYWYLASLVKEEISPYMSEKMAPYAVMAGFLGSGVLSNYLFGNPVKKGVATVVTKTVLPVITNGHFDPSHITPLESVEMLRGKITCPVMLHHNENDGVLANQEWEMNKLFDAFSVDNKNVTLVKSTDGWHNSPSQQFGDAMKEFNKKHFSNKTNENELI
jgi:hypothetical protein